MFAESSPRKNLPIRLGREVSEVFQIGTMGRSERDKGRRQQRSNKKDTEDRTRKEDIERSLSPPIPHMHSIPASGVHVPHFVHLDAVWDGCVDKGKEPAVGEGMCLGVDVEGVAGDEGQCIGRISQRGQGSYTHIADGAE